MTNPQGMPGRGDRLTSMVKGLGDGGGELGVSRVRKGGLRLIVVQ